MNTQITVKDGVATIPMGGGLKSYRPLVFTDKDVEFKGVKILYSEVTAVQYNSVKMSVNFVPTNFAIQYFVLSGKGKIKAYLNTSQYGAKYEEALEKYALLVRLTEEWIEPAIINNSVAHIKSQGSVTVCRLTLTKEGIYHRRFFLFKEFIPWSLYAGHDVRNADGYIDLYKRSDGSVRRFKIISTQKYNSRLVSKLLLSCIKEFDPNSFEKLTKE